MYFTAYGLKMAQARLDSFRLKYKKICGQKSEAYENGGNGWHDNFAYEDLLRQEYSIENQILKIEKDLREAILVNPVRGASEIRIGSEIVVSGSTAQPATLVVVGAYEGDAGVAPQKVEYCSPLVIHLLGLSEGDEVTVEIAGKTKVIEVLSVR